MIAAFVLLSVIFVLLISLSFRKRGKLPPGPPSLPIIGNIHQLLGQDVHLKFCKWSDEYGKFYTVQFGHKRALIISDPKLLKDLFSHPSSYGRFKTELFLLASRGPYGIVNTEGDHWSELKGFCARTLKSFGLSGIGRLELEQKVLVDIHHLLDELHGETQPLSISDYIKQWNCKVMWKIIAGGESKTETGSGSSVNQDRMTALTSAHMKHMGNATETGLAFVPWFQYIAPDWSGYNKLKKSADDLYGFIREQFQERKKTLVSGTAKCIMDAFAEKLNSSDDPKSCFYGELGMKNGIPAMLELVTASGDTTPLTLNWLMLYLAHHQTVQQKMCQEIDRVIGHERDPSLLDRKNMPYYEAVLQEVLRKSSIGWMSIPHQLLYEIEFNGYTLPKGLILLPNLYHVHHDPATWGDPENFRPERFISEDSSFVRHDCMMPFGIGRRNCFGEGMARDVMFLFIVKFFQVANIFPESSDTTPNFKAKSGFLLTVQPFKVTIKWRGKIMSN